MTGSTRYLTMLYCATAGKQGADLGTDESQIVMMVYLIFDVLNNKVVDVHHKYVKPLSQEYQDQVLTAECKLATGINEEDVKSGATLEAVLDEMERFFIAKGIHPEVGGSLFTMCTDGPQHFRLCIHPETTQKAIKLQSYYYQYFDIRKEFQKLYKRTATSLEEMLEYLAIEKDSSVDFGMRQVYSMANVVKRLIHDGHQFGEPEKINERLQPGICSKSDFVDDDTVVRARGLPWQSSDSDIAKFFTGLNIAKGGVALCLSQQGRRNGEALVRFECKESRDLALKKHKHHLGNRYIEVYKASGKDFLNIAGGTNTEAQAFLSQGAQCIVRMRGLPYTATAEQVLQFFRNGEKTVEVHHGKDGIMFVHQLDGRATGDAFVLFATEEDANIALSKHRELIGSRYIELFKSTTAEVQQVLNRTLEPQTRRTPPNDMGVNIPPLNLPQMSPPLLSFLNNSASGLPPIVPNNNLPIRDCIRLRGLPFEASVADILNFLGEHSRGIVFQGVHMVYNAAGTPSGEAFIQMDSELAAEAASVNRHKKFMLLNGPQGNKKRYIEVFQCSSSDMSLILANNEMQGTLPVFPQMSPSTTIGMNSNIGIETQQQQHAAMNLTPPGLCSQVPPSQNSPPASAFSCPPFSLQSFYPRQPLLSTGAVSPSSNLVSTIGPYSAGINNPLNQANMLSHQLLSQLAQQQFLLSQQQNGIQSNIQPRQPIPALYGQSPVLYYYPSPPISPQNYYNAGSGANATDSAGRNLDVAEQERWQ